VRRHGLRYIGVPELHKKGGLHFHFAMSGGGFHFSNSGTVTFEGHKKPVKWATAKKWGIPEDKLRRVYNITDWKLGFSTAIFTYGERGALATYLAKELCKDEQKKQQKNGGLDKIGGRWYLHGGALAKPVCRFENRSFAEASSPSYELTTEGGDFKVWKLDRNGAVLR
jgi:hypothetical protein